MEDISNPSWLEEGGARNLLVTLQYKDTFQKFCVYHTKVTIQKLALVKEILFHDASD